jgi:CubicO group peptidase (beta-lactamase class C family)
MVSLARSSAALLLVSLGAVASAQTPLDRAAELDAVLAALHAGGLFDGALAISENGEVVYGRALGTRDGQPLTTQTPRYLASVSKAMTAAAVLSLVAHGRVDLDADVGGYLDPWPYAGITVRHLLNQTSGLHFLTTLTAYADTSATVTTADLLALVDAHRPGLGFEPGTAYAYDNANYAVLGALLEAVTGEPFGEVLRARVFEPAGMTTASVASSGEAGWIGWSGGDGAAVHASAEDLLAFDRAWRTGALVPLDLVREAETPPELPGDAESRYGFGRFVVADPRPLIGHFGEGTAAKSGLWRERGTNTTYAIVMPGDGIHRTAILTAVMALWNGEPYELPQARRVVDVPPEVLARHVGVYASGMGRLHITLEDGRLHLEPEGAGGSEPLLPASETVFYFGHQDLTWVFVRNEAGETTGLMVEGQPQTLAQKEE